MLILVSIGHIPDIADDRFGQDVRAFEVAKDSRVACITKRRKQQPTSTQLINR